MIERQVTGQVAPVPLARRGRGRPLKPCPCCGQLGGFCEPHKARLAEIRDDMIETGRRKVKLRPDGMREKPRPARCCNPQCDATRARGENFCAQCQAEGWEEAA